MDVRQAVDKAKAYLRSTFENEGVLDMRLEEVEFDEINDAWLITLGVLRPGVPEDGPLLDRLRNLPPERSYKIIRISNRGDMPSIKIRELGSYA